MLVLTDQDDEADVEAVVAHRRSEWEDDVA
jgi:hypothetical protein